MKSVYIPKDHSSLKSHDEFSSLKMPEELNEEI